MKTKKVVYQVIIKGEEKTFEYLRDARIAAQDNHTQVWRDDRTGTVTLVK